MKTEQPVLITSLTAQADLSSSKNLLISFDAQVCTSGQLALGVINANTNINEQVPVVVSGIALVKCGAAVSNGDALQSDANGKAITKSTGELIGYSLDDSTGADVLIRVLLK